MEVWDCVTYEERLSMAGCTAAGSTLWSNQFSLCTLCWQVSIDGEESVDVFQCFALLQFSS